MEYRSVASICPYCGAGCGLYLEVLDGAIVGVLPRKSSPVNQGGLCIKGWNAHAFVGHAERLTQPLIRHEGKLEPASWEEALDLTAERLGALRATGSPDCLAVLASAKATNEENYLVQKFARAVLGTNNLDHCARL